MFIPSTWRSRIIRGMVPGMMLALLVSLAAPHSASAQARRVPRGTVTWRPPGGAVRTRQINPNAPANPGTNYIPRQAGGNVRNPNLPMRTGGTTPTALRIKRR